MKVYHYTSQAGMEGILEDRVIRASTGAGGKDASFGAGVYFTTISPDSSHFKIILNNWDGARQDIKKLVKKKMRQGGIQYALAFDVPDGVLERVASKRDVWLYRGDFYIDQYTFEVCERDEPDHASVGRIVAVTL